MLQVLLLTLAVMAGEADEEEGFRMNDLGGTVFLPDDWKSKAWADWELDIEAKDSTAFGKIWFTSFQVPVTVDSLQAWTEMYAGSLKREGLTEVKVMASDIQEIKGRKTGVVRIEFLIDGKVPGVGNFRCFTGEGKVIHVRTVTAKRREARSLAALESIVDTIQLDGGPSQTAGPRIETSAGFAATLPDGWRAPLRQEIGAVRETTAKVGEEALASDDCWVALHPPPVGDPDVIFACKSQVHLGPLDEHSFQGVEAEVYDKFFGRSDKEVPHAEAVTIGDRMGLYYRPPVAAMTTRLAMAPYEDGLMVMWGLGHNLDEATLDTTMMEILPTVEFTGPDGGAPIIGADKRIGYYLKYRTFSAYVLCPVIAMVLALIAMVAMMRGRSGSKYEEF